MGRGLTLVVGVVLVVLAAFGASLLDAPDATAQVPPPTPSTTVSIVPDNPVVPVGTPIVLTGTFADVNGWTDLRLAEFRVADTFTSAPRCLIRYDQNTDLLKLFDGVVWLTAGNPGSGTTVATAECSLNATNSLATAVDADTLDVSVELTFGAGLAGARNLWLRAFGDEGAWGTDGIDHGDITITSAGNATPTTVSATPPDGTATTGVPFNLTAVFDDANGFADLQLVELQAAATAGVAPGCRLSYDEDANLLQIWNGVAWLPVGAPASGAPVGVTDCSLDPAASSVIGSGTQLSVTFSVTFNATMESVHDLFLLAVDGAAASSTQDDRGNLTVNPAAGNNAPTTVSVTPNSGAVTTGTPINLNAIYHDLDGHTHLSFVEMEIAVTAGASPGCRVGFDHLGNDLQIWNGATWLSAGPPGSGVPVAVTDCSLDPAVSSETGSGNQLGVNFNVTFNASMEGPAFNLFLLATDAATASSTQDDRGDLSVTPPGGLPPGPPVTISVSPNAATVATGTPFLLTGVFGDGDGWQDIRLAEIRVAPTFTGSPRCLVRYDQNTNELKLFDAGAWHNAGAPGTGTSVQNPNCTLDAAGSSAVGVGSDLTVIVDLTFKSGFEGTWNLWLRGFGDEGVWGTAGVDHGDVTITAGGDVTAPGAPTGLAAGSGDTQIALDWTDNSEPDLAGYNVYRALVSGGPYTQVNPSLVLTSAFIDTGLTNDTAYFYVVTALDGVPNESINSSEASATPAAGGDVTPPGAPTGLSASPGSTQIALDWTDNTEPDLAGYNVYRSLTTGGPYTQVNPSLVVASTYLDTGLTNGTPYFYVVTALDGVPNESINSGEASATPTATPPPSPSTTVSIVPSNPVVAAGTPIVLTGTFADLNGWADLRLAEFRVATTFTGTPRCMFRYDQNTDLLKLFDGVVWLTAGTPGSGGTVATAECALNAANSSITAVDANTLAVSVELTFTANIAGVRNLWLRAFGDEGAWGTAGIDHGDITITTGPDVTAPAAPSGLVAAAGDTQVSLDWSDNGEPDLAGYHVYRSLTTGGPYTQVNPSLVVASAYLDTGLINDTPYFYVVTAVDGVPNESSNSAEATATPTGGGAPTLVTVVDGYTDAQSYDQSTVQTVFINAAAPHPGGRIDLFDVLGNVVDSVIFDAEPQTPVGATPWFDGFGYAPSFTYNIGTLPSGIYLWDYTIPFVVKDTAQNSPIRVVLNTNTMNAYNCAGGQSLYACGGGTPGGEVSFERPFTMFTLTTNTGADIPTAGRFGIPFFWWLEQEIGNLGSTYGALADADLENPATLDGASVLVLAGHSEYWTRAARENVDAFVAGGGDLVVLSGNTMWWQARLENNRLVSYKSNPDPNPNPLLRTLNWNHSTLQYPIFSSIGADFTLGGFLNINPPNGAPPSLVGYKITTPASPLLEGTNLALGDVVDFDLLGTTEFDGAPLAGVDANGFPQINATSLGFYKVELIAFEHGYRLFPTVPTMIAFQKTPTSGQVVNAANMTWSRIMVTSSDASTFQAITFNALHKLLNNLEIFAAPDMSGYPPTPPTVPITISVTPNSGSVAVDTPVAFTGRAADANGWQDLRLLELRVSPTFTGTPRCLVRYDQNLHTLKLSTGTEDFWLEAGSPGSGTTVATSECSLDAAASSMTVIDDTTLDVTFMLSFTANMAGTTNLWLRALEDSSVWSTIDDRGDITITTGPDVTAPGAPTGLAAGSGDTQIALDWTDNSEPDLAGYNVYRALVSGGPYTQVNPSLVLTSAFIDTGLTNDTAYFYVVTALDGVPNESINSSEASATPAAGGDVTPPGAPTGLSASPGSTQIALDWTDNTEPDLAGYNVYRSLTTGGPYTQVNPSLVVASTYLDTGLTNGTPYFYVVTALDGVPNESINSGEASATPTATPPPSPSTTVSIVPSNPVVAAGTPIVLTGTFADLNGWADLRLAEFRVATTFTGTPRCMFRYDQNTDLLKLFDGVVWLTAGTPGSGGTVATAECALNAANSSITAVDANTLAVSVELTFTANIAGVRNLWLRAFGDEGAWGTAGIDHGDITITTGPDVTAPAAPSGLVAAAGDTQVSLDWSDNGEPDLAGYHVYRSLTTGGPYTQVNPSLVVASAYLDTGLINDTPYFYVVTAVDGVPNESSNSAEATATPVAGDTTPPTVTAVSPANDAINVAVGTSVTVTFSEPVDLLTVTSGSFILSNLSTTVVVAPDGLSATLTPLAPLTVETVYSVTVTSAVTDVAGNPLDQDAGTIGLQPFISSFTSLDVTPPTIIGVAPVDLATDIPVTTAVTVAFSEPVNPASLSAATFAVSDGSPVAGSIAVAADGLSATFTPTANLEYGVLYTVTITTGITDLAGNPLTAGLVSGFTTTPPVEVHIASIDMVLKAKGPDWDSTATITVMDEFGALVANAQVFVTWTLPGGATVSKNGLTDAQGQVSITAAKTSAVSTDTFWNRGG